MKNIRLIILATFFTLSPLALFAMPGFESYLPDNSGEYVFYKDNTFTRESYVGMLYYDESTLQIRYYAPQDNEALLPEKNIAILITVNPESAFWEMTGERIISTIMPETEDMDIVNYLHDLLYEFSAHRIKTDTITGRNVKVFQDYEQFGGNVAIIYDCTIPMFNIKNIESAEGDVRFQCCTVGQLAGSADKSFDDFKGFPSKPQGAETNSKSKKQKSKKSAAKTAKFSFENQAITLDSDWTQPMENFWMLGNDSMVTLGNIPAFDADKNRNESYVLRRILESAQSSYTDFSSLVIKTEKNRTEISSHIYQSDTDKTVISTKILAVKKGSDDLDYFSISTFEKAYNENASYFQKIVKSYSN